MKKIAENLAELIGHTPLLETNNFSKKNKLQKPILVKIESFNPGGSVKDRPALYMIQDAEAKGLLNSNAVIVEATSGNMGIGIAAVAASKGYKTILTMPESMSIERRNLLKALGAEVVLTPAAEGMKGAIKKAEDLVNENPNAITLRQFDNQANPLAHRLTTAEEIWADTDGEVDVFVAGVGTGGTITGVAEGLKRYNKNIKIIALEPEKSPFLTEGKAGPHMIQGIGAGFSPINYHSDLVDRVFTVGDKESIKASREFSATEGILVGISSGAALAGAVKIAKMPEFAGKNIVTLLPDTGERYLSTALYAFEDFPID